MHIKISSNRSFIIKVLMPLAVIAALIVIMMAISLVINYEEQKDCIPYLICLSAYAVIMIGAILIARFYKGKSYEFIDKEISIYNRGYKLGTIDIANVESISFYKWRFTYIITIFAGALNDGGCWKLYVKLKDGTKRELAFFSKKDAKMLKEKLYGELLNIQ